VFFVFFRFGSFIVNRAFLIVIAGVFQGHEGVMMASLFCFGEIVMIASNVGINCSDFNLSMHTSGPCSHLLICYWNSVTIIIVFDISQVNLKHMLQVWAFALPLTRVISRNVESLINYPFPPHFDPKGITATLCWTCCATFKITVLTRGQRG